MNSVGAKVWVSASMRLLGPAILGAVVGGADRRVLGLDDRGGGVAAVEAVLVAEVVVDAHGVALLVLAQTARQEDVGDQAVAVEVVGAGGRNQRQRLQRRSRRASSSE